MSNDTAHDYVPLTPFHRIVSEMVLDTPAPGKHCARSAMVHIQRAWAIRTLDPEMSAFRAITGEEESATAIIHALQRRKYSASERLNPRDHRIKSAVIPFLDAIAVSFVELRSLDLHPTLEVDTDHNRKRLRVRLTVPSLDDQGLWVYPEPPLGFNTAVGGVQDDFTGAIRWLETQRGLVSLVKQIEQRANYRNRLLYANGAGVPKIVGPVEPPLLRRRDNIYRNLIVFLLIDQYPERQIFAQQALNGFLGVMKKVMRQRGGA